jgi:hypothetical protein
LSDAKILSVTLGPMPRPQGLLDPLPTVRARFDDGSERDLFYYYPDEISFTEAEFVGLTAAEAHRLRYEKDLAYLRR